MKVMLESIRPDMTMGEKAVAAQAILAAMQEDAPQPSFLQRVQMFLSRTLIDENQIRPGMSQRKMRRVARAILRGLELAGRSRPTTDMCARAATRDGFVMYTKRETGPLRYYGVDGTLKQSKMFCENKIVCQKYIPVRGSAV